MEAMQQAQTILAKSLRFSAPPPDGEEAPTKQELQTLTEAIKLEASKMGFVWGSSDEPTQDAAQSLFSALEHRHSQFCTVICRAGYGAGPTLADRLLSSAQSVTEACISFVEYLSAHRPLPEGQAAIQTGRVWAACDAASTICLDNRSAIGLKLVRISKSVKDTIREIEELVADSKQAEASGHSSSASSDGSADVDLDFQTEPLSPVELKKIQPCMSIIRVVFRLLKHLVQFLLTQASLLDASVLDNWESLLFHAKSLGDVVNDLGAALFPPQQEDEIASTANSIDAACLLILDELPEHVTCTQRESIQSLVDTLDALHGEVAASFS